ncbi:unnamed protein product [Nesidiocoris tenuis]|uniref:Uncharacterized protein n=1 Tax=Nesidiocoris tenuis TaxID=355587 RepID=A0A6H5GFU4_9HEMI|nr:unnamed protein product [Nesidiocoris tenuis]
MFDYELELLFHCEFDFDFDYKFELPFHCEFDFEFDCQFDFRFHWAIDFKFDYELEFLFHCEFDFEFDYEIEFQLHFLKLQTSNICERWSVFPRPPRPPTSTYTRDLDRPGINTGQLIKRSLPASACTRSKRPTMSDRFARLGAINAPLNTRYNTLFTLIFTF